MRADAVPIKPWVDLDAAFRAVRELPAGHPKMVLVHGDPGLGKTTAVDTLHLRFGGVYTVASSTWSQRTMLEKLADRLGVSVRKRERVSDILDNVLTELETKRDRMICIDEFDRIVHKPAVVELVREIYDISDVPVVLVGMGSVERSLSDLPQFPQRIGRRVRFEAVDLEDAHAVAQSLTDIKLTDDLVKTLWKRSGGIIRLLVTEIAGAEEVAVRSGLESIGLDDMDGAR